MGVDTFNAISRITFKRLVKDYKDILNDPLHSHGIHYLHDEENILCGSALIIGQKETPYENGYYLFDFKFPPDYPHAPLSVTFLTNDGETRMHPNFYKTGYVCLSILNNWKGEQWTGCLTLKSVLLTMVSIMDEKPLLHEPGIRESHADFSPYHRIIEYKTIEFACCRLLNRTDFDRYIILPAACKPYFYERMCELFTSGRDQILERVRALKVKYAAAFAAAPASNSHVLNVAIYKMQCVINYDTLTDFVESVTV